MAKRIRPPKERQECPSECVACSSAASGYHYDAPSCTSCKTFFRRTVLQERLYISCLKEGDCKKEDSVRQCRACRFERCVSGGMNPLLIISLKNPEANVVVQRFMQRSAGDGTEPSTSTACVEYKSPELVILPKRNPSVLECTLDRIIGGLLYLENAHQELRSSPFDPRPDDGYRLDMVLGSRSLLNRKLLETHSPPCDPDTRLDRRGPPMPPMPEAKKHWPFADLLAAVEYLKTFEFFHYLSHEDKKALARHVSIMCSQLTLAYFSYERKSNCTVHPDGTMPHGGFVPPEEAHEHQLHHGVITILRLLEMDRKEYVLLKAIMVCNPAIEDLSTSNKEELEKERLKYSRSLMSYVMYRRGHEKGPAAYTAMMAVVDTLTHLMKRHKNFHVLRQAALYKLGTGQKPSLFSDIFDY